MQHSLAPAVRAIPLANGIGSELKTTESWTLAGLGPSLLAMPVIRWIDRLVLAFIGIGCGGSDYVGSRDCQAIATQSTDKNFTQHVCDRCQAETCTDDDCASLYPCVDDKIVIQGCDDDADCRGLGGHCSSFGGLRHTCSIRPDP
jgi:hypothetical protein